MKSRTLLLLVLTLTVPGAAYAQSGCPDPKANREEVWRVDTLYTLRLDPSIERCRNQIQDSLNQWNPVINNTFGSAITILAPGAVGGTITLIQGVPAGKSETEANAWGEWQRTSAGVNGGSLHINPIAQDCRLVAQHFGHEIGHPSGLQDCSFCPLTSSVMARTTLTGTYNGGHSGPQACDQQQLRDAWDWRMAEEREPETSEPDCPMTDPFLLTEPADCSDHSAETDPLVLDVHGNGVALTSLDDGVRFDANADGFAERVAWTRDGSDDAWLVLDRNGNGRIDDGTELFGNYTPQPLSAAPNGYIALGELESSAQRGNGDHVVDAADAIWHDLRLWRDANHDGVSHTSELSTLAANGVEWLEITPRRSGRRDRYGNFFRYRAKAGGSVGRWTYDVFLRSE